MYKKGSAGWGAGRVRQAGGASRVGKSLLECGNWREVRRAVSQQILTENLSSPELGDYCRTSGLSLEGRPRDEDSGFKVCFVGNTFGILIDQIWDEREKHVLRVTWVSGFNNQVAGGAFCWNVKSGRREGKVKISGILGWDLCETYRWNQVDYLIYESGSRTQL